MNTNQQDLLPEVTITFPWQHNSMTDTESVVWRVSADQFA